MNWSDEDVSAARSHALKGALSVRACTRAIMDKAIELLRARGGTMTAEELDSWLRMVEVQLKRPETAAAVRQHTAAQGAEVATLHETAEIHRQDAVRLHKEREALREKVAALEEERDEMRRQRDNAYVSWESIEAEAKRLHAELARLKPSGQVAEDDGHLWGAYTDDGGHVWVDANGEWGIDNGTASWAAQAMALEIVRLSGVEQELRRHMPDPIKILDHGRTIILNETGLHDPFKSQPVDGAPWRCAAGTCGHDDAAAPGHADRVKAGSEAFNEAAKCPHPNPTFIASGECGQCNAERPVQVSYTVTVGPFHPSTEEDWDLSLVEEALTEAPDSAVSNGARYWRRRFLKIVDRLGWVDVQTLKERTDEAHNKGVEAMRAACLTLARNWLVEQGYDFTRDAGRTFVERIKKAAP